MRIPGKKYAVIMGREFAVNGGEWNAENKQLKGLGPA